MDILPLSVLEDTEECVAIFMKIFHQRHLIFGLILTLIVSTGCSHTVHKVHHRTLSPQLCGGISDQRMQQITHLEVESGYKNSLGCVWSVMQLPAAIEFSVYRDSNYMKEISYDKLGHGIVKPKKFGKYSGLVSKTSNGFICELILPFDRDFVVWTLEKVALNFDPCAVGTELMNSSVLE